MQKEVSATLRLKTAVSVYLVSLFCLGTVARTEEPWEKAFKPDEHTVTLFHLDDEEAMFRDDEEAIRLKDESANHNDGQLEPSRDSRVAGKFGKGLQFTGKNRVGLPLTGFDGSKGSVEMWLKFDSLEGNQNIWGAYSGDYIILFSREKFASGAPMKVIGIS